MIRDRHVKQAFLSLLQSGLWDVDRSIAELFPLSSEQWESVYQIAVSQTVEGLVYQGWLHLPQDLYPPKELQMRWTIRIDQLEKHTTSIIHHTAQLSNFFSRKSLDVCLLKGLSLSCYYAHPLQRSSGDIDFYFDAVDSFQEANFLMQSRGIQVGSGEFESSYYQLGGCTIEHHTRMLDICNPFVGKYIKQLEQEEKSSRIIHQIADIAVQSPSCLMSHVQVNAHILKHYLGFGIGLRQFCDVARLYTQQVHELDSVKLRSVYRRLGLFNWMELIHSFLIDQLGLDPSFLPYAISKKYASDWLMDDILLSGNFGFFAGNNPLSGKVASADHRRNQVSTRVLPHIVKALPYAISESIWYPLSRVKKLF